jgi:hypothetical protein
VGVATFAFTKWPSREGQRTPSGGRSKFHNIAAVYIAMGTLSLARDSDRITARFENAVA